MYCSEAPCGDASMELVMDAQEDATPWISAPPTISASFIDKVNTESSSYPFNLPDVNLEASISALRGRSNFSHLGSVRLKPSRPDAPPTLSKSCTDKLALKQGTSILSSVTSALISPRNAYINSLVLPDSQYVPVACERAFSRSGRLSGVLDEGWEGGYRWQCFEVKATSREFSWSRRNIASSEKAVASNISAVWTPTWQETLIGGVLQGRKQLDPRGASRICRRGMWGTAVQVVGLVGVTVLGKRSYEEMKGDNMFDKRRKVKDDIKTGALKGWVSNRGDGEFRIGDEIS
jgi:tRNA-specific adenosine deaminase 1